MDDTELVLTYIEKTCNMEINVIPKIKISDGSQLSMDNFNEEIQDVFSFDTSLITKVWIADEINTKIGDTVSYLSHFEAVLGNTNWIIKHKKTRENLSMDNFVNLFKFNQNEQFLRNYYDNWESNLICDASEKMMGFY